MNSSPSDRLSIHQIETVEETSDSQSKEENEAPPPTRHGPPDPERSSASDGTGSPDPSQKEITENADTDTSRTVRSIATLTAEDTHPEIVGGMGALYLQIHYPKKAREQGIEGLLILHFTVDKTGDVRRIEVSESLHPLCDSAAVRALRSVEFRPATRKGEPIPIRMSLPVRFQLRSDSTNPRTRYTSDAQ